MADNPFADLIPQSQANPFVAQGRPDDSDFATAIQDAGERSPESAVSPKGARGAMQVMPGTVAAPGFGVAPATSEADLDREGRDYSQAMLRRYGDARLAAAAYDAGPGTVDDWLEGTNRTGRNPKLHRIDDPRTTSVGASWLSQIPFKETRDYVGRVAGWLGNAVVPSAQAEELGNPFADLVPKKAAPAAANPFADLVPTTPLAPRAAEPPDTGLLAAPFAGLQEALRGSMQSAQAIGATGPLAPVTKRLAGAGASAMEEGADALHWLSTRVPGGDMLQSVSDWMRPVSGRGPEPGPTVASQPLTLAGPLNVKSVAEKTLYGLGESAPTVAGAVAGGVPGAVTAAVMQSYGRNLEAHNGDVGAAAVDTAIDAAFTGLGFKAFEYTPFKSTVKDLLAQGLAIQPAIAMTERAVMNVRDGRPATEGLPDEYLQGALPNTLTMGLAHLAAAGVKPEIVAIQPAKGEAQAPAPLPSGPKGGPPPSPASAAQPVEPVLQTGSVIGLNTPAGVPRRAEVVGSFENGRYTTLRFEDGSHRDFRTEEVMRDRTEAPPRAQESATPTVGVEPVSEAERFDLEGDYLPPQAPRVFPQPVGLGTEAIHGLDQARGLELAALDTTNKIPNAQRQDMLAEAARLRRLYGAPEESQPESYRHPLAAEPARGLGELAAARVARPELYEPQSPEDARASQAIDKQAATTETAPSDAQKEAGNYRKGQIKVQGMDVSIETPRNAERTGISPEGEPWANRNPLAHYGYIKRTAGADGDHVDAYVGPHPGNPFVYVVDQVDPRTGVFDEHKAVIGAGSERQARAIYDAGFSDGSGPDRLGAISKVPVAEFKDWLKTGDTKTPFNPMADPEFRNAVQEIRDARSTSRQSADILSTIVAMGGIRLTDHTGRTTPEGQTVAQILQDYRRPGLVNNRNGMTPDYLREALTQQGWFGDRDPTQTELQPFYDMLDRAARGEKIYHPESGEQAAAERRALIGEEMGRAGIAKSDSLPGAAKKLLEFRRQGIEELISKYEDHAQEYVSEMSPASQAALVEYGYEPGADIGAEYETEAELPQSHGAPETARAAEPAVSGPELGREGAGEPEGGIPPQAQVAAEPVDLGRGVTAEQTLIPGTERSARQLAAAREAQGHGRKSTRAEQREPEGLFAEKPEGQETLFQAQRAEPVFYSAAIRTVENTKQERAPAQQWLAMLRNQPGVKAEELNWMGLPEWLAAQRGSVTKADLLSFMRANEVSLREIERGSPTVTESDKRTLRHGLQHAVDEAWTTSAGADELVDEATTGVESAIAALEEMGVPDNLIEPFRTSSSSSGPARYGEYTLPGGQRYRELLLTLPLRNEAGNWTTRINEEETAHAGHEMRDVVDSHGRVRATLPADSVGAYIKSEQMVGDERQKQFRSGHWDEPNVLAHVRFDDRTGPNGEKILHVAEIQSDWAQRGRREGFIEAQKYTVFKRDGTVDSQVGGEDAARDRADEIGGTFDVARSSATRGVPNMPFKSTEAWSSLAMKRVLRYAAEHGYDKVTWDTGDTNAERYDLSKHIDSLSAEKTADGRYTIHAIDKRGHGVPSQTVEAKNLPDIVGKDLADKIIKDTNAVGTVKQYHGLDLKVGGHGMRSFYDKILPAFLNKYAKKWGAKVEDAVIGKPNPHALPNPERGAVHGDFQEYLKNPRTPVHSITITPKMRESVMGGQPLFQRGEAQGPAPGQRIKIGPDLIATLPDNPDARERAILNNVSAMMRKIVPTAKVIPARRLEVGQAFREQSRSTPGGEITGANFTNGMRRIITWSLSSPDAIGTGRHEAIHYLKSANFFTPAEWKALVHGAMQGDWIAKHDIEARYPDAPLELKTEEAIAEEFGQWQRVGTQGAPSRIASAFEKMRALFSRVSDYMRRALGADVTADNVFSRIRSGEVGARSLQTRMERVEPSAYQAQANRPIPEAPETMPEGREYFDNVADALGEHLKEKGAGTYARRMAAGFSDTLGRPSKYLSGLLGSVEREIIFPRTLSATDWRSAKYWDTNVRKLDETARLLHEAAEGSRRYIDLSTAQRAKLHAVEELVRLKGITLDDDGRTIVMRNDIGITRDGLLGSAEGRIASLLQDRGLEAKAARDAAAEVKKDNDAVTARVLDYLNPPLAHSRFGQTIELDGDTSKAFFERRDLFRQRWRDLMRGAAKRLGWDGEPDPDAIRRAIADRPHDEGFRKSKERIATLLDDMKAQERQGYVPLMRFGDYFISVTPKIGKDEESLGGFPRVAHFELVDSAPSFLESVESGTVRREGEVPKSAQEKIAELRATYPESAYDIEHDYVSRRPERLRDLDVPAIEKMLTLLGQKDTDLFGPMVEELRDKFYEEMRAGFKKRSYSVPGYSPDFARAAGAYMHWTANHVADMVHGEDIRAAEEHYINAHPDPGTRQYWKDWKAYQESPAEQMRKLQKFGFYWELAGNLSSSAAIALHGPMVGTFTLGVGLGPTKTGVGRAASFLYPALGRIVRAIRADSSRGLYIDTSEIKGLSPKERVALDKADRSGLLHSAATEELAGMSQQGSEALTPKSKFWRRAGNIAGSNIAVVDRMNRMGIWLAAYRMAQNPSIRETWAKTWGDNQVFRELTARDGMTPETLARFMVDEGAFVWGKTNRPQFARGEFGALITTFRGFEMNYLSTLWKLGRRMGPSGKLSALAMMAALGGLTGAQGLPFVQDVEGASEWLSKHLTGVDPMIEAHLYRFMEDAGFSKTGAEMVLKGAPRSALGIDLSNRLGFGNIATKDLGQNPLAALGAVPGIVYNAVTSAENRAAHGQPIGAAAAMLPAALRNPVEGLAVYPTEGVRTQYQHPWQPAVVAPKDLGIYDELVRGAGFEPANVARAYEQREFYRRLGDAMRARAAARVRSGSGVPASVRGVPNPYP